MSVWKNGSGWVAEFAYQKQRYRSGTFRDKTDAEVWELEARAAVLKGLKPPKEAPRRQGLPQYSFSALAAETYKAKWRDSKRSEQALRQAEIVAGLLGNVSVSDVTKDIVTDMVETMRDDGLANGTINRKLSALSVMLGVARDLGWLKTQFIIPRLQENEGRITVFSPEEEMTMLEFHRSRGDQDSHDLIVCLLDCGARLGNVMGLRWVENVVMPSSLRWFPDETKARNQIVVPMTSRIKEVMQRREGLEGGPFLGIGEKRFRARWQDMRIHMGRADDPEFLPHGCRHTFITRLLEAGTDVLTVQQLAGHKCLETTKRYAHFSSAHFKSAIGRLEK